MRCADATAVDEAQGQRRLEVVGELRRILAEVSVACLEPDLIILDEFQRFKHLLERPEPGAEREVSQLAHDLFTYERAKVLLLSATPYKMYTLAEERELTGDDHYSDFIGTVAFLEEPRLAGTADRLKAALSEFRRQAITGGDPQAGKDAVEALLRTVMCRTERPVSGSADMMSDRLERPAPPTVRDMLGFVALTRIAEEVGGALSVEYWKSAPYFLNFMDGYQLSEKFRQHELDASERTSLLEDAQVIRHRDLDRSREIEPGNARLRQLVAETLDRGLWRLLWLPPSLPYHEPSGVFAEVDSAYVTKRLIFSSWAAAPTAISSLLSWAAVRRIQAIGDRDVPTRPRLAYRLEEGRPCRHDCPCALSSDASARRADRPARLRAHPARRHRSRRSRSRLGAGPRRAENRRPAASGSNLEPRYMVLGRALRHRRARSERRAWATRSRRRTQRPRTAVSFPT